MDLKHFINDFDIDRPDWSNLPMGFPNFDYDGLDGLEVGKLNAIRMVWELSQKVKPVQRSRMWTDPKGYRFLVQWNNAVLLRILAVKWVELLKSSSNPLNSSKGYQYINRLEAQFLDCLRSVIANIEEGFVRPTTQEYLNFLGYSQASLAEGNGDMERSFQDGLLRSVQGSSLKDLGIDLKEWNDWAKDPLNSSKILYFPLKENKYRYKRSLATEVGRNLKDIKGENITYEILKELFNKTDWNLRKLVESLEKKQNDEHKFYQVEKARVSQRFKTI